MRGRGWRWWCGVITYFTVNTRVVYIEIVEPILSHPHNLWLSWESFNGFLHFSCPSLIFRRWNMSARTVGRGAVGQFSFNFFPLVCCFSLACCPNRSIQNTHKKKRAARQGVHNKCNSHQVTKTHNKSLTRRKAIWL